ncbi:hypothetical protein MNBD_ALPHA06-2161 [hydrothermal vent metagenome]|uniref:Glycine zipper 2TM domain-containing protein n=1 Tax=hydrothermal vent metagenome TaxID=652676 RepID=A0A3B0QZG8_9ZZZZ
MFNPVSIRRIVGTATLSSALLLGACASNLGANDYDSRSIGQISRSDSGVVVSSRNIRIEGQQSGVGAISGAAVGGVAGSALGGDHRGSTAGGILGVVLGGLIGAAIEQNATEREGFAYTVQLDSDGEYITITQGGKYPIANGTPVWVEYGDRVRVIPKGGQGVQGDQGGQDHH